MSTSKQRTTVSVGPKGVRVAVGGDVQAPFDRAEPWFTPSAIEWLKSNLPVGMTGIEYGGGGSTPWWADRLDMLYTVEANPKWALVILDHMRKHPHLLAKWRMWFVPCNWHHRPGDGGLKLKNEWARNPEIITPEVLERMEIDYLKPPVDSADLVVIDGAIRAETVEAIGEWTKIRSVQYIVVDNTESEHTSEMCDRHFASGYTRFDFPEFRREFIPEHQAKSMTSIFVRSRR